MLKFKPIDVYLGCIAVLGLGLLGLTTALEAPKDLHSGSQILITGAILLTLTILSSLSPMQTRQGSVLTVGMAPLFGALILLPPWAVMWVAALGTMDERIPGRGIPWIRFLFNRGMFALAYGIPSLILAVLHLKPERAEWYLALALTVPLIIALNVGLVAGALSLLQGAKLLRAARNTVAGSWLTYVALPIIGYLIYVLLNGKSLIDELAVFLLYGPLLVYRTSLQKQNRLDRWLRDSFIMQSRVVDKRDGQTHGHSQRVGEMSEAVARLLHLSEDACNTIRVGGILHDLGKIAIPDSILLKPGKLTPEEYEIIKTHPTEGAAILAEHPEQKDVAQIVRHHHERWDGAGYPDGLRGVEIPIGSRIVNACDAFDTITQARVFRPTVKTPAEAIRELRQLAGTWYDPDVISAMEKIVGERWGITIASAAPEPPGPTFGQVVNIKSFRRLWIGQAVSYFGDMMNTTGLAIMLFVISHSASVVALGLIAKAVPTVCFGLVAGPIVDRFNRQRVMVFADLARALLTVTIPFFAWNWLPGVFLDVFLIATASTLFNPAKQAIIPNIVSPNMLVKANSLVLSSERAMELLGYSLAGIIAAAISWMPLFLIDAGTYLFSAVTLLGVPDTLITAREKSLHIWRDVKEGMRFVARSPVLRSTMALTTLASLFAGMTFPTLVVFAYKALNTGAFGYGVLEAAIGGGAIIGAVTAPRLMHRYRAGILILAGIAGFGASYALAGLFRSLAFAVLFLFACGAANTVYLVPLISLTQREAPDFVRGRVLSSRFLLVQAGLLVGMALSGPLSDRIGAPLVFVTAGVLLVCAAFIGFAFRNLRDATLRDEPATLRLQPTGTG
ncbi:MAG: MFS transporter [Candidatus Dormibacteraeota bacterium]|nr:MFS transporter [Candidatus Dormibacteraeota bacterium]